MNEVNLRQLEVLAAVVEYGSFTEAGNRLYLAQSTVSSHIRGLEEALHVVLFRRESKRRVLLTPEGKRVYQYAREILSKCQALQADVGGDTLRELVLGASSVPAQSLLPGYMSTFLQLHPGCCCDLKSGDSSQVQQMLLDGSVQLGFVGSADDRQDLVYERVAEDQLVMITPNTPRFAALRAQGVLGRELFSEPMIFREYGSGTQKMVDNYLSHRQLSSHEMQVVSYVSDPSVLQQLVARGAGVSILSSLSVRERAEGGKLLVFPLEEEPVVRHIFMAWRKKGSLSELARSFCTIVRNSAGSVAARRV